MSKSQTGTDRRQERLLRREWLQAAITGAALFGVARRGRGQAAGAQDRTLSPAAVADKELELAAARVKQIVNRGLRTVRSASFQAVGDGAESFMNLTLGDCERIQSDYLTHYQAKGFDIKRPERRLTLVILRDERPYAEFLRTYGQNIPIGTGGFYSRVDNWLVLFDYRNVPMSARGAGDKNIKTLAHEATHLLTFNTGLLNRLGDSPRSIVEGIAAYGETRSFRGRTEPGQLNATRLDELALVLRRQKWISAVDLLTDDVAAFGNSSDRWLLAYAESWLLVYHLMTAPGRVANLQAYLKKIYSRSNSNRRFDDAEKHLGDLDRLDEELRRASVRLQQTRNS
jgi:Protein of unknown function (DUF1570)